MNLGKILIAYRQKYDISTRGLAKDVGVAASTINRIEQGHDCDIPTFSKLLQWMMKP